MSMRAVDSHRGGVPIHLAPPLIGEEMNLALYEAVLRDDSLPRIPKQVLLYLVYRSNPDRCFPSQTTMAKQLQWRRQSISAAINLLRAVGRIKTVIQGKHLEYDIGPCFTFYTVEPSTQKTCPLSGHIMSAQRTGAVRPADTELEVNKHLRKKPPSARDFDGPDYESWERHMKAKVKA
jgi:hypothetical protein